MSLAVVIPAILMQVGPVPNVSSQAADDFATELQNRPSREAVMEEPDNPVSIWLAGCLDLVETDPARAHAQAQIRRNETTGAERVIANHCLGLAATELELWSDAQTAFLAARDETPVEEIRTRSRFGSLAGNAALGGGDLEAGLALLTNAQEDAKNAQEGTLEGFAAFDRARALDALGRQEEALGSLDNATRLIPQLGDAWLFKATLLRRSDRLGEAQAAIERAVEITPNDPQIGLEAGVIAVLDGREEAARASWQSVIDSLPDSRQADAARGYIAQLGPPSDTSATP
ncbi:MAG: hypothetical protein AAGK02_03240 [Pseudomonadota bacterium]